MRSFPVVPGVTAQKWALRCSLLLWRRWRLRLGWNWTRKKWRREFKLQQKEQMPEHEIKDGRELISRELCAWTREQEVGKWGHGEARPRRFVNAGLSCLTLFHQQKGRYLRRELPMKWWDYELWVTVPWREVRNENRGLGVVHIVYHEIGKPVSTHRLFTTVGSRITGVLSTVKELG